MDAGGGGQVEIEEELEAAPLMRTEEKVWVMVGKEGSWDWMSNLQWVFANIPRSKTLVFAHVHLLSSRIKLIMGAPVHVSQFEDHEVEAYRKSERQKIDKLMDDLLALCARRKLNAEKRVIESDDTLKGMLDLMTENSITELVLGAASDRRFSKRMKSPKSKKALAVLQNAGPACRIWFICKGHHICTREVGASISGLNLQPRSAEHLRSKSFPEEPTDPGNLQGTVPRSVSLGMIQTGAAAIAMSWGETSATPQLAGQPRSSLSSRTPLGHLDVDAVVNMGSSAMRMSAAEAASMSSEHEPESDSSSFEITEETGSSSELYGRLKAAMREMDSLKHEAYQETRRRQQAERDLVDARRKANAAESSYRRESKQRKNLQEMIKKEEIEMDNDKEQIRQMLDQIKEAERMRASLELQIADSRRILRDREGEVSEAYHTLNTLRAEALSRRNQNGFARHSESHSGDADASTGGSDVPFLEFTLMELREATGNFDESFCISTSSRGSVYRATVRSMTVAITVLRPELVLHKLEFTREVRALSKVQHQNLAAIIGACVDGMDTFILVSEFVPSTSLQDHLSHEDRQKRLSWRCRAFIASKICSTLMFLHSYAPMPLVHGDLKPEKVILTSDCRCKLADFGISSLLDLPNAMSNLCGGISSDRLSLAYVDPNYLATGALVPDCDIYAFGMLLLYLLTCRPPFKNRKLVRDALEGERLHEVLDAREWPLQHAREVALVALRCCDSRERAGPGVLDEARRVLDLALDVAPRRELSSRSIASDSIDGNGSPPSYFMCPIFKEVMRDPHIAADGFTYEADAIREWFQSGRDTSPMTNLQLETLELVPNHALRALIQEWLRTHSSIGSSGIDNHELLDSLTA